MLWTTYTWLTSCDGDAVLTSVRNPSPLSVAARLGSGCSVLLVVLGAEGTFSLDRRLSDLARIDVVSLFAHGVLISV
jgi:hypothetical protein